jgi:hypothetical protein
MLCEGEWLLYDDGIARPTMRAEIRGSDGIWRRIKLLLDTGADRTVISADVLRTLGLQCAQPADRIGGVGGLADSVDVTTQIRLTRDDGQWITLRGTYAACLQTEALDMSVLGRDVLDLFAVIVDRAADRVVLLHGSHSYAIQRRP